MTTNETAGLLQEIAAAYPLLFEGRDAQTLVSIWQECLAGVAAKQAHRAFIRYYSDQTSELPPTPGMLLEYMPEKDRLPFLGWDDDE